jgi:hypothetical protein
MVHPSEFEPVANLEALKRQIRAELLALIHRAAKDWSEQAVRDFIELCPKEKLEELVEFELEELLQLGWVH